MACKSIITIGRQYGSGGREIGQKLAEAFGIKCYDNELLDRAAKESGICQELFENHDEKPTNSFLYSLVMDTYSMGYASSALSGMPINHKVFLAQFNAIKDIAKEAGVSATTVSNVIHGNTKKVSKANIEKIQRILEEHQYIPSMSALMLAENRSRLIGVLIGGVGGKRRSIAQDPFTSMMLSALELEIYRQNYYMLFHMSSSSEENWKLAATWKVEGLITLGLTAEENIELAKRCQIPLVSIDNYYYGQEQVDNIGLQDFEGGYKMGKYLIDQGMKRILFLADNDIGVDHERWMGLKKVQKRLKK